MLRGTYYPQVYSKQTVVVSLQQEKVIWGISFSKVYYTAEYELFSTAVF